MDRTVPIIEETSTPFLGRWQRLVSTTNWEKGRIIAEWRTALIAAAAPASDFSDEAWSRRVNNVSSQHVGRLRRVFERFGTTHDQYAGLFWSHFQAALDWEDGEMWLEGAVQSGWSVAHMRRQRWETLGGPADEQPLDSDIVTGEFDEDAPFESDDLVNGSIDGVAHGRVEQVQPLADNKVSARSPSDHDDVSESGEEHDRPAASEWDETVETSVEAPALVQPFANLPSLPQDLYDAFEAFKLAILRHRLSNWHDVPREDVLSSLESLKQFALAPVETNA